MRAAVAEFGERLAAEAATASAEELFEAHR